MPGLADELMAVIRPEIEAIIDEKIEEQLRMFERTPWMTTEEAATYMRLSAEAVRQRAQRGTIPAHKDDAGRWVFHREELDAALRSSRGSC